MNFPEVLPRILLLLILIIPLALVIFNRMRMDLAALLMAAALGVLQFAGLGMLGPANSPKDVIKAISGFSQPVVITLLSLFIITRALDKSGVTRWIAHRLVKLGGHSLNLLIGLFTATAVFMSLFMNNLAVAALLLPSAMEVARQTKKPPSKLLIPVAFGSLLGGSATYFTTANIIVSNLLQIADPPQPTLNILDFTPTGGLIAIAGIIFLSFLGNKLLPDREPSAEQALARLTGSELEDLYHLGERLWEAKVMPGSTCVGKSIRDCGVGEKLGIVIAALRHDHGEFSLPFPQQVISSGDTLLLVGREEKVMPIEKMGIEVHSSNGDDHLTMHGITVAEVLLAPHTRLEGQSLKEMDFRKKYGLTVVAMRRLNRSYRTDVGEFHLTLGDSLLVIGRNSQLRALQATSDFIVLMPNPADQPMQKQPAFLSIAIILAAIAASIAGVPVYLSMLVGAVITVLLRLINMEEAYRAVEWQAIFLIAGMYVVSLAMVQTGMAKILGNALIHVFEPMGSLGMAAGAYLLSAGLTQIMGGQVTALVTGPVTISAAISMHANPQAIAVATAIGCSASFLTPMAHPVNILMIGPGNYKFTDFVRVGWMLTIIAFIMLLLGMMLFWGM